MQTPPELSIVVPLYNEAGNVQPLVQKLLDVLQPVVSDFEILLVDDASTDGTWDRIVQAQASSPRVRGVRHARNMGQSAALFTGFRASGGRVLGTLDGDLQNDPADFPKMLSELRDCDMVCGVRARRADTWVRKVSSGVARWARRIALGVDFADTGCNLRVFKREVLYALPAFRGCHRFAPVLAHSAGALVKELPVSHHPRAAGISKYGIWNRIGPGILDLIMVGILMRRSIRYDFQSSVNAAPSDMEVR
jgi:dolichol-phosphate mannosyltransferase